MSTNLIQDIKKHIETKPTEELLDIWSENDREKWSAEYFEAVRLVLLERNEPLPEQTPEHRESQPAGRNKKMRSLAIVFLLIGVGLYIFISLFIYIIVDLIWPASPISEILWIIRNILVTLCAVIAMVLLILTWMRKEP